MKAAVIVFPGSNCDRDVSVALEHATGHKPAMVWHRDSDLPQVDLIVVPGGFSYGDYLRSGAMAAQSPVMREVVARAKSGTRVLGICNGFQILTEAKLLPGALMRNAGLKFLCRTVDLRVENADSAFTAGYAKDQLIRLPVAHHDGNYFADADTLARIEDNGMVAFRYVTPDGAIDASGNPNGSANAVAGLFNEGRTVLGLMPHPERAAEPLHGNTDGKPLLDGLVEALS
ncbi:phosphoribosylformylglycinamidine synthase [Skermanella stibiiresistens SB22]|uniref:Phosphoribosylformylglycinamidine synthase subunit PurQ n=1 Tax=Skermanella stibiiresistens SB22 TaxID=1385369 RepID=W9HBB2_9PROT|nr:phosphoribosylformylglycinamidine synthase subunit PurQ [Skermanella stibiiresistens]EWY42002.1 phosphoribosylformylglycinamidine synthase [Skermanella stibiiresistens SB22]